jgi:hypothetical protein
MKVWRHPAAAFNFGPQAYLSDAASKIHKHFSV